MTDQDRVMSELLNNPEVLRSYMRDTYPNPQPAQPMAAEPPPLDDRTIYEPPPEAWDQTLVTIACEAWWRPGILMNLSQEEKRGRVAEVLLEGKEGHWMPVIRVDVTKVEGPIRVGHDPRQSAGPPIQAAVAAEIHHNDTLAALLASQRTLERLLRDVIGAVRYDPSQRDGDAQRGLPDNGGIDASSGSRPTSEPGPEPDRGGSDRGGTESDTTDSSIHQSTD